MSQTETINISVFHEKIIPLNFEALVKHYNPTIKKEGLLTYYVYLLWT